MIFAGIILALLVGLARGGSLAGLGTLNLRGISIIAAVIMLRVAAGVLGVWGYGFAPLLQVLGYIILIYFIWLNISLPGIKIFGAGSILNFIVIAANGGRMPVSEEAAARAGLSVAVTGTHTVLTADSRFWFLADIIAVSRPFPLPQVLSIGDFLIAAGIFFYIQHRMLAAPRGA